MFEFSAIVIAFLMGLGIGWGTSWVYHAPLRRREHELFKQLKALSCAESSSS